MDDCLPLVELADRATATFLEQFGREPSCVVAAPGRVNLIGEHTDYNEGYVLPMAINRYTVLAADRTLEGNASASSGAARVFSATLADRQEIPLAPDREPPLPTWAKYVQGVLHVFADEGISPPPFDAVIDSTVPLGGGLSSSAALEVAVATLLETLTGQSVEPIAKALLCQRAEHLGVGMPCGIMDQLSAVLCQADQLMLLDCRSQQTKMVPLAADADVTVLVINSNVRHELVSGEYAARRRQCAAAARALGVSALRDVTVELLEQRQGRLDSLLYRRARHVVSEIQRTVQAAHAIETGRWQEVGELIAASHDSLRDDYEVSCPELDLLVETARALGPENGVIGSRMTGGGFGGCTVSLVRTAAVDEAARTICDRYQSQTGIVPTAFVTPPAQGACVLRSA